MQRKNIVVLTGAGISAESGLSTFRGMNGLWEGYRVEDVASPEGWKKDPNMVNRFYNMRRAACRKAVSNAAHFALRELENYADVQIITQNVDDLHERAGSKNILHLHGEITKVRSTKDEHLVYDWDKDELSLDDTCELGSPLRPHIVWFGEAVPNMEKAIALVKEAEVFLVVGTSLQVYPAASLLNYTKEDCELFIIDPNASQWSKKYGERAIVGTATEILPKWIKNYTK